MVTSEREMVQKFPTPAEQVPPERFTSLQPTYEDSVPDDDVAWDGEHGS